MRKIRNYELLKVAHSLVLDIYKITKDFPDYERFGIISQMRRAAYSIPANIIEGNTKGEKEFIHFLKISLGSCEELRYFLLLSKDLQYLKENDFEKLEERALYVIKMIRSLIAKITKEDLTNAKKH